MSDILDNVKKDEIYEDAISMMYGEAVEPYEYAIMRLKTIRDWKDSEEKIEECYAKIRDIKDRNQEVKAEEDKVQEAHQENLKVKKEKDAKQGMIIVLVVAAIVIAGIVWGISSLVKLFTVTIPTNKYENAMTLISQGEYVEAYEILVNLKDFKDSKAQADAIYVTAFKQLVSRTDIGAVVSLGSYEGEQIQWYVMDKDEDKVFLLSKYGLEIKPYNESGDSCTWETCTLRAWLNNEFYSTAFNDWESELILTTNVIADINPNNTDVDPGANTLDKVFLLSVKEVEKYFENKSVRMYGTKYLSNKLGLTQSQYIEWWTRTPGYKNSNAVYVTSSWNSAGMPVDWATYGVRPAMWIDVSIDK